LTAGVDVRLKHAEAIGLTPLIAPTCWKSYRISAVSSYYGATFPICK